MFTKKATVKVKNSKGEVIASQEYDKQVFEGSGADDKGNATFDANDPNAVEKLLGDALAFLQKTVGEKGNGVIEALKHITYSFDLGERAKIRQRLETALEGPDKAIEKAVKDYMVARAAMGKPVDEATARRKVMED